jgi:hypothetical protein
MLLDDLKVEVYFSLILSLLSLSHQLDRISRLPYVGSVKPGYVVGLEICLQGWEIPTKR